MKIELLWRLFSSKRLKAGHKKYIFFAMVIVCLEFLDIIVYISNANLLTKLYLVSQLARFSGLMILLIILWLTNFSGKFCATKLLDHHRRLFFSQSGLALTTIGVGISLCLLAATIVILCKSHFCLALAVIFLLRLVYQTGINLIVRDIYEVILNLDDVFSEFVPLIVNGMELSLLLGILGYKLIAQLHFAQQVSLMAFVMVVGILWIMLGISMYFNQHNRTNLLSCQPNALEVDFGLIFQRNHKDSLIGLILVGIKTAFSIVGVLYMPLYLTQSLLLSQHAATNIITLSSLSALGLNLWLNQHLHKFDYTIIIKYALVGMIVGSLISYLLFMFQLVPLVAVAILMLFHSFFTLSCPMILNNLFSAQERPLAIVACYRSGFFIFSTVSFALIILLTQTLSHYLFPSALLFVAIIAICYFCMVLVKQQPSYRDS